MRVDTAITMLLMTLVLMILTAWLIIAIAYHDTPCIITVIVMQCAVIAIAIWGMRGDKQK